MLDALLEESRMYRSSAQYMELLAFVVRLRNFAPFNAMLLQIQKPGLMYAATRSDWMKRFGRVPKEGRRPLLILWPFAPVALVYDVADTDGPPLPDGVRPFQATGAIDEKALAGFRVRIEKKRIQWVAADAGEGSAGSIGRAPIKPGDEVDDLRYRLKVNASHAPAVQFATLAHELGHLFLSHLGRDKTLGIPTRIRLGDRQREIEAESVSYIVCTRNGVQTNSEAYLSNYVQCNTTAQDLDIYQILRAAGQVESMLGLAVPTAMPARKSFG